MTPDETERRIEEAMTRLRNDLNAEIFESHYNGPPYPPPTRRERIRWWWAGVRVWIATKILRLNWVDLADGDE